MTDPITTPEQMREAAIDAVHEADSLELATHGGNKIVDRIRAIPVAQQPVAVTVKPLADDDREWIDARADELFRESERRRGGIRGQTIVPQDFRDYFVATATYERILSAIDATPARDVRAAALREAASVCAEMADQVINAALTGIPEQARLRESMESALTKASHQILALIDKEPQP